MVYIRLQFEIFVVCVLWKKEYTDLTIALNDIE